MKPAESNSSKKRRSRFEHPLCESLNKRLTSYVAAAGATGVCLLVTAASAKAHIVYTPTYTTFSGGTFGFPGLSLDLNHDGIADFYLGNFCATSGVWCAAGAQSPNDVLLSAGSFLGYPFAAALTVGKSIGPSGAFGAAGVMIATANGACTAAPFCGLKGRFLGLKFSIRGKTHFGWARLNSNGGSSVTLTGYAYETVPNKPIRAGQTGPVVGGASLPELHRATPATATLQRATLGVLALGSRGLDIWRKEQDVA
jgi:hypothetical protein